MKKIFASLFFILFALSSFAQKDVTKFLGIPVDGTKSEMIRKLEAKGFKKVPGADALEGEFNGNQVYIRVVTNNNKVYRILITDVANINERSIQIRFNNLCDQFENNENYISFNEYTLIPDDEDISYEMMVHKKRYQAAFYQRPSNIEKYADSLASISNSVDSIMSSKYTIEQLENPTEEIRLEKAQLLMKSINDFYSKKSVWFIISGEYGKYYITMFYDNEYNRANGEDL